MFFVHWKSLITGNQGCGTRSFPHDEAQRYADELNRADAGILVHWIENAAQSCVQLIEEGKENASQR